MGLRSYCMRKRKTYATRLEQRQGGESYAAFVPHTVNKARKRNLKHEHSSCMDTVAASRRSNTGCTWAGRVAKESKLQTMVEAPVELADAASRFDRVTARHLPQRFWTFLDLKPPFIFCTRPIMSSL